MICIDMCFFYFLRTTELYAETGHNWPTRGRFPAGHEGILPLKLEGACNQPRRSCLTCCLGLEF